MPGVSSLEIPILSVIVCFGPGEKHGRELIETLIQARKDFPIEVLSIVAKKSDLRAQDGQTWLVCPKRGRAHQLNFGAKKATGQWLWFLHADSLIVKDHLKEIMSTIRKFNTGKIIGYFPLSFVQPYFLLVCLNQFFANKRAKIFRMPFGDQGIFLKKNDFYHLGEFPLEAISGEDHLFIIRARRNQFQFLEMNTPLRTSARKYQKNGWAKTSLQHIWLTFKQEIYG